MKSLIYSILLAIVFALVGWFANTAYHLPAGSNPTSQVKPTPLYKYAIENLAKTPAKPVEIQVGDIIKTYPTFSERKFYINFDPSLSGGPTKRVSGVINIPSNLQGTDPCINIGCPVIVMFRGYVDPTEYFMGEGTEPAAQVFAQKGYITIAPDFLGYGESDKEAADIFESRFQTYTTATTVLASVKNIKGWDGKNIFIWAHSNGGQIALTTLEITGAVYPTVLWAPVSMPFPASILYYTIEADDQGKYLVKKLSEFNDTYDSGKFSLTNYLSLIKAPIQLNQGSSDEEVPYWISDDFAKKLKEATVSATYIKYPGNDHNMSPNWTLAVQNALAFFNNHLEK